MNKIIKGIALVCVLVYTACSDKQTLQEYYVENQENPEFLIVDIPASILNMDKVNLTDTQQEAVNSLRKLNVLAYQKKDDNEAEFTAEKTKVNAILKDDRFVELMKINTQFGKGVVKYLGEEDAIDEVVIFGASDDKGFAVIRVLGENMNPAHLVQLIQALDKSDFNGEGLEGVANIFK
ncbi:DUF4252 domain-containing protein [Flavobacterium sp. ASW18X]|uniref:DUF4252 domain-containing protein n=1 Tax=Flavobacterium sp. ASW18X TaxID=2572595 RepID=UPI0010AE6963|nr:DUF4252 domain-containing protein [Flavobacterium sp. ASW18X]TKD60706.1 DUF4252 domain-containing protein [Flavobacterium sp. ASW18X]